MAATTIRVEGVPLQQTSGLIAPRICQFNDSWERWRDVEAVKAGSNGPRCPACSRNCGRFRSGVKHLRPHVHASRGTPSSKVTGRSDIGLGASGRTPRSTRTGWLRSVSVRWMMSFGWHGEVSILWASPASYRWLCTWVRPVSGRHVIRRENERRIISLVITPLLMLTGFLKERGCKLLCGVGWG